MGVINVTPDSFSDGGAMFDVGRACARVDELLEEGAAIIDVGGESTRPGFEPVPAAEQIRRTGPVIRHAVARGATVSIDTTEPEAARAALDAGAVIVNDVSCLGEGDELARVAAQAEGWLLLMHARERMTPSHGYGGTREQAYGDIVEEVSAEWLRAANRAEDAGLSRDRLLFDPGLGFNKTARHSAEVVRRLAEFTSIGAPIVVGPSRKSFLAAEVPAAPARRVAATAAACIACVARGARVLRVHDVLEVRQALAVARAIGLLQPEEACRA